MPKKIKLKLEELKVDSFETSSNIDGGLSFYSGTFADGCWEAWQSFISHCFSTHSACPPSISSAPKG